LVLGLTHHQDKRVLDFSRSGARVVVESEGWLSQTMRQNSHGHRILSRNASALRISAITIIVDPKYATSILGRSVTHRQTLIDDRASGNPPGVIGTALLSIRPAALAIRRASRKSAQT
jgi:hypothetical protein